MKPIFNKILKSRNGMLSSPSLLERVELKLLFVFLFSFTTVAAQDTGWPEVKI